MLEVAAVEASKATAFGLSRPVYTISSVWIQKLPRMPSYFTADCSEAKPPSWEGPRLQRRPVVGSKVDRATKAL